jgi:hypothetical protein
VLLHLKKFQVLLFFWFILFTAVNGSFMRMYGVNSLYLAPEYLGNVNFLSTGLVGLAFGIFIMSWNITTFILFSRYVKFLATTSNPFLKYCINNAVIPLLFLFFYFFEAVDFGTHKELLSVPEILLLTGGFVFGLFLAVLISFYYFFTADKSINRRMTADNVKNESANPSQSAYKPGASRMLNVQSYFDGPLTIRAVRDVSHYSRSFLENVFSRHHFAAVLSIFAAFVFLIIVGFFLDNQVFQLPAAASVTIFFSILVAVAGAFSYFLQSWSVPVVVVLILILNILYRQEVIDPTNKAYGLNYGNTSERPVYDRESLLALCSADNVAHDCRNMIGILEKWKKKQKEEKPVFYIIATSGGGTRSATFTLNVLQYLDSVGGGHLMDKTFMITGASGGMLGAAYFRELSKRKGEGHPINLHDKKYVDDISRDLLNPMLSSFVARDLASPSQRFRVGEFFYIKDRGFAFEQKLAENTRWILNKQLKDIEKDELSGKIPLMLFNAVITRDSRRMIISTQPVSFLMRPMYDSSRVAGMDPDAVDFSAMFKKQGPMNMRLLSAMRMNATFPYVLPNVWLPSKPVVDVMDAGLRDNYGQETALRFLFVFREWIRENTSKVVLIQIRDRKNGGWETPVEGNNISEIITKPMLLLQYNYYKMQEFSQNEIVSLQSFMNLDFHKLSFQYVPREEDELAALNFHLTKREKQNIAGALQSENNARSFSAFKSLSATPPPAAQ